MLYAGGCLRSYLQEGPNFIFFPPNIEAENNVTVPYRMYRRYGTVRYNTVPYHTASNTFGTVQSNAPYGTKRRVVDPLLIWTSPNDATHFVSIIKYSDSLRNSFHPPLVFFYPSSIFEIMQVRYTLLRRCFSIKFFSSFHFDSLLSFVFPKFRNPLLTGIQNSFYLRVRSIYFIIGKMYDFCRNFH